MAAQSNRLRFRLPGSWVTDLFGWILDKALTISSPISRLLSSPYKWPIWALLWITGLTLGYVGFNNYYWAIGEPRSVLDNVYQSLRLIIFESGFVEGNVNPELQAARFLVPAMTFLTIAFAAAALLPDKIQNLQLWTVKGHIVLCGLGRKGLELARGFLEKGEKVVIIEQDENNSFINQCKDQKRLVVIGNAADKTVLRKARAEKAKYVISVCGEDDINAEVVVRTRELVSDRRGEALTCLAHIFHMPLCNLLRELEFSMGRQDAFRPEMFNIFESGARALLREYPPFTQEDAEQNRTPHIAIIGAGWFGETVVVNAAREWWDYRQSDDNRIRITVVDLKAKDICKSLYMSNPQMEDACELIPLEIDITSHEFERARFLFDDQNRCKVTRVYVCLFENSRGLAAALALNQQLADYDVPIVIRMDNEKGLATLLEGEDRKPYRYSNLSGFGFFDHTCTLELLDSCTYESLARACHDQYLANEKAKHVAMYSRTAMVPWDKLPEEYKQSNIRQAEGIKEKLQAIGCDVCITKEWDVQPFVFSPEEIELMAKMEHERWMQEKINNGWIYGEPRDDVRKKQPDLKPWDELSEPVKDKDRDSARDIPVILSRARFRVIRISGRDFLEVLAEAAHEAFCDDVKKKGYVYGQVTDDEAKTHSSLVPYNQLPENEKESNRNNIQDVPNKLKATGYVMVPRKEGQLPQQFLEEEIEQLARMEHERWMQEKIRNGWVYAPQTDKLNKRHKLMLPWEELPEEEKEKDRVLIRAIPDILAKAGYTMIRKSRQEE